MADWKLFNSAQQFTWAGTYNLATTSAPPMQPPKQTFSFDAATATLTAGLEFAHNLPADLDFVVGIVILGSDGIPLNLNYTNLNQPPQVNGAVLTQAITLSGVTLKGSKAVVFVGLEQLPRQYTFQT